jgi:hypothetical protein
LEKVGDSHLLAKRAQARAAAHGHVLTIVDRFRGAVFGSVDEGACSAAQASPRFKQRNSRAALDELDDRRQSRQPAADDDDLTRQPVDGRS